MPVSGPVPVSGSGPDRDSVGVTISLYSTKLENAHGRQAPNAPAVAQNSTCGSYAAQGSELYLRSVNGATASCCYAPYMPMSNLPVIDSSVAYPFHFANTDRPHAVVNSRDELCGVTDDSAMLRNPLGFATSVAITVEKQVLLLL